MTSDHTAPRRLAPDDRSAPRVDAGQKLRGEVQFVGDLVVPRMLHGQVLRSPVPHARIVSIDTSAALAIPGVVAILTGADLPADVRYGHAIKDRPLLATEKVRFAGEPVAAVAAEDEATAARAARAIEVHYEDLPLAATIESALASGAPQLHSGPVVEGRFHGLGPLPEREGNVCYRYRIDWGDLTGAFAGAAHVVEGEYTFPAVYAYSMETHSVVASWNGDEVTLWATCQHPFLVRAEIADIFDISPSRVRVIVPYLGGGFGSKSYTKMEPITAALARKAGRPVRIVNRVDESMVTTRRHNMRCWMRTGASADGQLIAREVRLWLDTGAYADNGPRVTATAGDAAPGPYRWTAVAVDAACVYTNTPPSGSYRAFGASHLQWIGESQVDEIARRAGVDSLEIRRRNLLRPGEMVRPGAKPLDADLVGDIEKAARAVGWGRPKGPNVGRGLGVGLLAAGALPVSNAIVRMEADGAVAIFVGTSELGQGSWTVLPQIAARELSIAPDRIRVRSTDTLFTPYDRSTGASRSTTLAGLAVQRAAASMRRSLLEIASETWGISIDLLRTEAGSVHGEGRSVTYPDLLAQRFGRSSGELTCHGEVRPQGNETFAAGPVFWEVCVAAAEVAVDPETGIVHVRRTATVADVGKAINPQLVERQDHGATLQGLGNALFEEMIFSDGLLTNDSLLEYRIPTTLDVPDEMTSILAENEDGPGPYGDKGCGEGALAGSIAAVVTALADAGVSMHELPLPPERVWRAMRERGQPVDG